MIYALLQSHYAVRTAEPKGAVIWAEGAVVHFLTFVCSGLSGSVNILSAVLCSQKTEWSISEIKSLASGQLQQDAKR